MRQLTASRPGAASAPPPPSRRAARRMAAERPPERRRRPRPLWRKFGRGLRLAALLVAATTVVVGTLTLVRAHDGLRGTWLALTAGFGLTVQEVLVTGRRNLPAEELLTAVAVERGDPLLAIDPAELRARVEALPWVRSAVVERRLPDTLMLQIEERRPLALWQSEHRLQLIDREGVALQSGDLGRFAHLPQVIGPDAAEHAYGFLAMLAATPEIGQRVAYAQRIGERRWDLRLHNGITVLLPETGVAAALARLSELQATEQVLDRDVLAVDLRLAERLFIRTTPAALERRTLPEEST